MADSAVCSFLTKILCGQGGAVSSTELPQHVELPAQQLEQLLAEAGPGRFVLRRRGLTCQVLAVSPVRLCLRKECDGACGALHYCKNHLKGRCHRPPTGRGACKYSHDIFSEENRKVLKYHELSGLNEDELHVLLLQNDPFLLPDVCNLYNKKDGNCPQPDDCKKLHICRFFLRGNCRFPRCKRSHDLMQPNVLKRLLEEGIDDKMAWNIQTIRDHQTAELARDLMPQRAPMRGEREKLTFRFQGARSPSPPPASPPSVLVNLSPPQARSSIPAAPAGGEKEKPAVSSQSARSPSPPPASPPSVLVNLSPPQVAADVVRSSSPTAAASGEKKKPAVSSRRMYISSPPPASPLSVLMNLNLQQVTADVHSSSPTAATSGEKKKPEVSSQRTYISSPPPASPPSGLVNLSPQQGPKVSNGRYELSSPTDTRGPKVSSEGFEFLPPLDPQGVRAAPPRQPPQKEEKKKKINEICLFYVWQFCKQKNNCEMIHYHLPYQWQMYNGMAWTDMSQMEEIEKAYCDPSITSFQNINFKTMMSYINPVRRLSTPSSITKEAKYIFTTKWLWYWKNDQGQWIEYGQQDGQNQSSLCSDDLENLFLSQPDGTFQFEAGSQKYEINFKDMTQRNLRYLTLREVLRRPKYVSPEDVKKKKGFVSKSALVQILGPHWMLLPLYKGGRMSSYQEKRIPFKLPGRSHRDRSSASFPEPGYPSNWDKSALPSIGYKAVELMKSSSEYTTVEHLFQKTMRDYVVHSIRRIQNPSLWQVFQWQKDQMKKKKGGKDIEEKLLFHGTGSSNLEAICSDNFDWRICGTNGTVYGRGSYFARDAKYSHNYCQLDAKAKSMFVARVLVGDFVVGHTTYNRPPARPGSTTSCYDSCVDKMVDPSVFVIFEKHQIYPAYVISYSEEKKCVVA